MWDIIENKRNLNTYLIIWCYQTVVFTVVRDQMTEFLLADALERGEY